VYCWHFAYSLLYSKFETNAQQIELVEFGVKLKHRTYTSWTSLNESGINREWWSTGAYKAGRHSTWSTAALLHQTLPVVSVSDLPLAIVAVGSDVEHSPWQVLWSGTCCLIISVIHRSVSDLFDQHWIHSFSQCTGTRSAVEALWVMRYTSWQSSSSSSGHIVAPSDRCVVSYSSVFLKLRDVSLRWSIEAKYASIVLVSRLEKS